MGVPMRKGVRINGPYKHGHRWRVRLIRTSDSTRVDQYFESEAAAAEFARAARAAEADRTIMSTLSEYLEDLRTHGGARSDEPLREGSVKTVDYRVRAVLQLSSGDRPLADVTPREMARLYRTRTEMMVGQRRVRPDTHRAELACAVAFFDWCVAREYMTTNPATDVRPVGRRSQGKAQLETEQAAQFLRCALDDGSDSGLACAVLLLFGFRASELVNLTCGDLSPDGGALRVRYGKTRNARRAIAVPDEYNLRTRLLSLRSGRTAEAPLWQGMTRYKLHHHVARICRLAGVPVVCPHGLRGTAATELAEGSLVLAKKLLGHGSSRVTENHYIAPGTLEAAATRSRVGQLLGIAVGSNDVHPIPSGNSPSAGEAN